MNFSFYKQGSIYLNGFLKNLPSNIEQNPSDHRNNYGFQDVCPIFLASFPRNSIPFMKYTGL